MAIIENKEIYDESQGSPFKSIIEGLEILNKSIDETKAKMASLEKAINQGDSSQIKELTLNIQKLEAEIEKLKSTEAAKIQIEKQLNAQTEKYKSLLAGEHDELIKTRVEIQNLNQKKIQAAKVASDTTNQTIKYRLELRNLKSIILTTKKGTDEYNKAMQRAAHITDELADMQQFVKGTAMDLEGVMGNVHKITTGVASGFEIAQGMAALFGKENEDLAKALVKVQAAMAIAQGLQGLEGFGKATQRLMFQMKVFAKTIKTELIATGIGAFVVLIGTLVAYWDDIKAKITGVSGAQLKLNELAKENLKTEELKTQTLESSENILKLQGKSERQIIELKKKQVQAEIVRAEIALDSQKRIHLAQLNAEKRNQDILLQMMEPLRVALALIDQTVARLGRLIGKKWDLGLRDLPKTMTNWIFDPEEMKKEFEKEQQEAELHVRELWNKWAGLQLDLKELNKKGAEDKKKADEERLDAEKKLQEEIFKLTSTYAENNAELIKKQSDEMKAKNKEMVDDLSASLGKMQAARLEDFIKQKEIEAKRREIVAETMTMAGEQFGKLLVEGNLTFKEFGKLILITTLEIAERMINLALVEILANEIKKKSWFGIISAGLLIGLVKGAFGVAKNKVQSFAEGTDSVVGPGTGTSDSIPARLSRGEGVIPANINKRLLGIGVGATDERLPGLVSAGLNSVRMESLLTDIKKTNRETVMMLRNGKNVWEKGKWFFMQDWETGAINKELKGFDD